jgi:hypothetical protein
MTQSGDRPPAESREYLEEIMKQEVEDSRQRQRIRRMRGRKNPRYKALGILLLVLVILIGLNVVRVLTAPDPFTPAQEAASAGLTVYLVAQGLEAYRDSTGFLPTDLESLDLDEEGLRYTVQDPGYVLQYQEEGLTVSYRSGESLTPLIAAYDVLERGGGQ